jgi:hypothetical protein
MIAALVITLLLAFAAGWAVCNDLKDRRAEREAAKARRAEEACEELRQQVMRGAEVARWTWPTDTRRTNADAFYFHVKTIKGDLLLTDEALSVALERATKLLRHDTPRP